MQTLTQIKALLESHGLAPRHALGQNFLIDHNLIRRLVDDAAISPGDTVLEIGPGTGTMTEELVSRGARVVACEMDAGLCRVLRERLGQDSSSWTLVEGDCLDGKHALNPALVRAIGDAPFRLVSNLPYGAGTPVILLLLTEFDRCRGLHVTIQREVALRVLARPSTKDYGTLSVVAQALTDVRPVATAPPSCFWPQPDVHSAMVSMRRLTNPLTKRPGAFGAFVQGLFEKRRKQLGAVLGRGFPFPPGVLPTDRAEALSVVQLVALHEAAG